MKSYSWEGKEVQGSSSDVAGWFITGSGISPIISSDIFGIINMDMLDQGKILKMF